MEIIITAFTSIIIALIGSKWFNAYMSKKTEKEVINETKIKLINHNIFTTIEEVRNDIKRVNFFIDKTNTVNDTTKESMFIDFMNNKLNSISNHTKRFIENEEELLSISKAELGTEMMKLMNSIILEYTIKTKNVFLDKGIKADDAEYVVNLFEEWRYDTVKAMKRRIDSLFSSEYYENNYEIILGLLEIFSFAILLIPKDGIQSFNSFNGKFSKIKYNK